MSDLQRDDEFLESILGDFIDESDELLSVLNERLLALDEWVKGLDESDRSNCDLEDLNEIFRAVHSLKGLSAMLRLDDLNRLAHVLENVFEAARIGQLLIRGDVVDLTFRALDDLGAMIESVKKHGQVIDVDPSKVIADIRAMLARRGVAKDQSSKDKLRRCQALLSDADGETAANPLDVLPPSQFAAQYFSELLDEVDSQSDRLQRFLDVASESVEQFDRILSLEAKQQQLAKLLDLCRRLKEHSVAQGRYRCSRLSHWMECVVQEVVDSSEPIRSDVVDALRVCSASIRSFVESARENPAARDSFVFAAEQLVGSSIGASLTRSLIVDEYEPGYDDAAQPSSPSREKRSDRDLPADLDDFRCHALLRQAPAQGDVWLVHVMFSKPAQIDLIEIDRTIKSAQAVGEVFVTYPEKTDVQAIAKSGELLMGLNSDHTVDRLAQALSGPSVYSVKFLPLRLAAHENRCVPVRPTIDKARDDENVIAAEPDTSPAQNRSRPPETLRVDIDRLDNLMNLAGQLTIQKSRFIEISERMRIFDRPDRVRHVIEQATQRLNSIDQDLDRVDDHDLGGTRLDATRASVRQLSNDLEMVLTHIDRLSGARRLVRDLGDAVHHLDRLSCGIQKSVMDTRMVPVGPLFQRFKRVARDLVRNMDKDVRLRIDGESTELDKFMIDKLGDPLVHMIRNSVDHGIENRDDRIKLGKPDHGTITLSAVHRGNRVFIEISDDGKGLDQERILKKAIEDRIVSPAEADRLSTWQICQLIWEPGFSTADKVTEISGRGVGMDIVRSKIEELQGTISVESESGLGTRFIIRLPLTMAILPCLLTHINHCVCAFPVDTIGEIVNVDAADLGTVQGELTAMIRGRVLSVVRVQDVFDWRQTDDVTPRDNQSLTVVVVKAEKNEVAVVVDGLIGEQDIVVKSLDENFRNVDGLAGASILGDGSVSLIVDVGALIDMCCPETHLEAGGQLSTV